MKPETKRTEIAKLMKWPQMQNGLFWVSYPDRPGNGDESDIINDLNAIAQARKQLKGDAIIEFIDCLCVLVHGVHCDLIHTNSEFFEILDAPADKQAEAILRALNLWVEDDTPKAPARSKAQV